MKYPEVRGLMGWRTMSLLGSGILASPMQEAACVSRLSEPATCYKSRRHKPPVHDCCGYYAMYYKEQVPIYHGLGRVRVLVSAMGETELCSEGWQARQIRIDEVWILKKYQDDAARIHERYGVSVFEEDESCESEIESSASLPFPPANLGAPLPHTGIPRPLPQPFQPLPSEAPREFLLDEMIRAGIPPDEIARLLR